MKELDKDKSAKNRIDTTHGFNKDKTTQTPARHDDNSRQPANGPNQKHPGASHQSGTVNKWEKDKNK